MELGNHPGLLSATSSAPTTSGRCVCVSRPSPATIPRHSRPKGSEGPPPYAWKCQPYQRVDSNLGGSRHGGVWTLARLDARWRSALSGGHWWRHRNQPCLTSRRDLWRPEHPAASRRLCLTCQPANTSLRDHVQPACRDGGVGMPSLFLCPPRSGVPGVAFVPCL